MTNEVEHLFVLIGYLCIMFREMSLQVPLLFWLLFFVFFFSNHIQAEVVIYVCHSCGNTDPLTHCIGLGIESVSWCYSVRSATVGTPDASFLISDSWSLRWSLSLPNLTYFAHFIKCFKSLKNPLTLLMKGMPSVSY